MTDPGVKRPRPRPDAASLALAAAAVVALSVAVPAPAAEPGPRQSLEQVEKSLQSAREREAELRRKAGEAAEGLRAVRSRAVKLAAKAQAHEGTLVRLGEKLADLERRRADTRAALADRRRRLGKVLAALQRLSMHPPVALIALPAQPADTVRSALLLRRVAPAIESQARVLREQIEALGEIAAGVAAAQASIDREHAALMVERAKLEALSAERTRLAARTRGEAAEARREAEMLGREARSLRDLVAGLARGRAKRIVLRPPPAQPAAAPRIVLRPPREQEQEKVIAAPPRGLPVRGRIVRGFGGAGATGGNAEGITIQTLPGAQVVAPTSGAVVFAGPFRGLGRLLIIEYGDEYHLLLAGLSRIDTAVGDEVLAGEPVGVMGADGDPRPTLYMELRRKSRPINPLPWLAARQTKVNG